MIRFSSILTTFLICFSISGGQVDDSKKPESKNTATEHPRYCVLFHTPGPGWKNGVPFQKQPGVLEHVEYMRQQFQEGIMVMGGPFLDDSGGMVILNHADMEKATAIANADPAVKSGLLKVSVKLWMVPMSSIQ